MLSLIALASSSAAAADFIGSASCRTCHQVAWDTWRNSPHARAHLSLTPAQAKDPRCIQCHAPDTAEGGDPGVTCETCHGAGEYYWPDYVMKDPELARATGLQLPQAADCLLCHDASSPSLKGFDPAQKMKDIDHWTASRAARGKKAEGPCELPQKRARAKVAESARPQGFLAEQLVKAPEPSSEKPAAGKSAAKASVTLAQAAETSAASQ